MKVKIQWVGAALLGALLCTPAAAADDRRVDDSSGKNAGLLEEGVEAKAFGGVQAPNARLAGLFRAGGAPVRTKGVQSIERTARGVYCIRPSSSMNVNRIIPSLTVEYSYSEVTAATVQWAEGVHGCGSGRIGVYTFSDANHDGRYTYSNDVAFSIVVP